MVRISVARISWLHDSRGYSGWEESKDNQYYEAKHGIITMFRRAKRMFYPFLFRVCYAHHVQQLPVLRRQNLLSILLSCALLFTPIPL